MRLVAASCAVVAGLSAPAWAAAPTVLDLRVVRADGAIVPLREVVGHAPAVVAFWASYCPPCRAEVPVLNRTAARWRPKGLRVFGVSLEDDAARVRDAKRSWDMRYDVVRIAPGEDAQVDRLFPRGLPASAFVARGQATLVDRILDDDEMAARVPSLMKEAEPLE